MTIVIALVACLATGVDEDELAQWVLQLVGGVRKKRYQGDQLLSSVLDWLKDCDEDNFQPLKDLQSEIQQGAVVTKPSGTKVKVNKTPAEFRES